MIGVFIGRYGVEQDKIFKHSRATVQNFNEVMRQNGHKIIIEKFQNRL